MARLVGHRGGKIIVVAEERDLADAAFPLVAVPASMAAVSSADIIEKGRIRNGQLILGGVPATAARIAMVGVWGVPCGIATYAEQLWTRMGAGVADYRIWSEPCENPPDAQHVSSLTWQRGQSLQKLADDLEAWEPDAVFIQHEYGIFPNARHWLAFMSRIRALRPIVTLHSVYHHRDKTICEAACPEIVVHSELAADVLRKEKGIAGKVSVIPHGCAPAGAGKRLYNLYHSPHTFMQFGFGFRYKNFEASIRAAAILKQQFPDVFFTGLLSEGLFSMREHDRYAAELHELIRSLGLQENVALIRGFQSEQTLDAYLGTNAVACFPYKSHPEHIVYGASGAARRAIQAGIPVVVSSEPHFSDFTGVCERAETPEALAAEVGKLFASAEARKAQLVRQERFAAETSWDNAAAAHLALL